MIQNIHRWFCHNSFVSALIGYCDWLLLLSMERRLIHILPAQVNEITGLISHPIQSPVQDPAQVCIAQTLKKRGGKSPKVADPCQGCCTLTCSLHSPVETAWPGIPDCAGRQHDDLQGYFKHSKLMSSAREAAAVDMCAKGVELGIWSALGWLGQWHRYGTYLHNKHYSWIAGKELGWPDTQLCLLSVPSVQPWFSQVTETLNRFTPV